MRWDIIKKAWALAAKKFPETKKLFVEMPDRFLGDGQCSIIDLEKPNEPLGKITYQASCKDGKSVVSLKLDEDGAEAAMPRFASIDFKTSSSNQSLQKKSSIVAADIISQYPDKKVLSQQIAYLIAGHEDGLVKLAGSIEVFEDSLKAWMRTNNFSTNLLPEITAQLQGLGIVVAKPRKQRFQNYQKVRVVDPRIMEYNEGAQVVGHRRDKEKRDWYQVIVDGSSKPVWLVEEQLAPNEVGSIADVSSADKQASSNRNVVTAATVWHRGRPGGLPEVGAHGAIWGTTDDYLAESYAGFEEGQVSQFTVSPSARIIKTESKFSLLAEQFKVDEDNFYLMNEDNVAMQMLKIIAPNIVAASDDQAMTMLDTMLTDMIKQSGYDGAELLSGETNLSDAPEIVIVNPSVIQWVQSSQTEVDQNERI